MRRLTFAAVSLVSLAGCATARPAPVTDSCMMDAISRASAGVSPAWYDASSCTLVEIVCEDGYVTTMCVA